MLTKERFEQFLAERNPQLITEIPSEDGSTQAVLLKFQIGTLTNMVAAILAPGNSIMGQNAILPIMAYCPFREEVFVLRSAFGDKRLAFFAKQLETWYGERNFSSGVNQTRITRKLSERYIELIHAHFTDDEFIAERKSRITSSLYNWEETPSEIHFNAVLNDLTPLIFFPCYSSKGTLGGCTGTEVYDQFYMAASEDKFIEEHFNDALVGMKVSPSVGDSVVSSRVAEQYNVYLHTKRGLERSTVYTKYRAIRDKILERAPTAQSVVVTIVFNGREYEIKGVPTVAFVDGSRDTLTVSNKKLALAPAGDAVEEKHDYVTKIFLSRADLSSGKRCANIQQLTDEAMRLRLSPVVDGKTNPFDVFPTKDRNPHYEHDFSHSFRLPIAAIKRISYKGKTIYEEA